MIIDIDRLSAVLSAIDRMADILYDRQPTPVPFNCEETNAVVEVLALAGHRESAANVLLSHAHGCDLTDKGHSPVVESMIHSEWSQRVRALADVDEVVASHGMTVDRVADPAELYHRLLPYLQSDDSLPGADTVPVVTQWLAEHGYEMASDAPENDYAAEDAPGGEDDVPPDDTNPSTRARGQ